MSLRRVTRSWTLRPGTRSTVSHLRRTTGQCRSSLSLAPRIGPARGVRTSFPSSAALVARACTAVTPAASGHMSIATVSNTNVRFEPFQRRPAARRGQARAMNAASPGWCPGTARFMPCEHRCVPKVVGAKRSAVYSPRPSPATTSTRYTDLRARRVSRSQRPIHCALASSRLTSSPGCGQCFKRSTSSGSTPRRRFGGSRSTTRWPPRTGRTSRIA